MTEREPDWDVIARVYDGDEPLAEIAEYYGITVQKIAAHAKAEGWSLRCWRTSPADDAPRRRRPHPNTLMKRLTALVERQIAESEERLATPGEARDHERDARTLSNLTRTLDKLIDLKRNADADAAARKLQKREAVRQDDGDRDGDTLRDELARRLARLAAAEDGS